jgi:hypothetical protein
MDTVTPVEHSPREAVDGGLVLSVPFALVMQVRPSPASGTGLPPPNM